MKTFHKSVVFTKTPLKKHFRYKDVFQIYPSNLENAPTSKMQRHHPVILEYWTTEEEKINVPSNNDALKDLVDQIGTKLTKEDKILSLLSTFSNNLFFRYTDLSGTWGVPMLSDNPGEEANTWASKWSIVMYHFPELPDQLKITEFSHPNVPEIEYIKHFPYYLDDPNFDFDLKKEIIFPETIHKGFDSYYSQSVETQTVLDTAISYAVSAMELRQTKKTLSILASFTSVETMVNWEFKDVPIVNCELCGQPQYKVAKKYRDYLLEYIGDVNKNKKKFNAYYSLRSKIVHTGQRLKTENLYADISQEDKDQEFLNHVEILQLGKLAIIQWLLKNQ